MRVGLYDVSLSVARLFALGRMARVLRYSMYDLSFYPIISFPRYLSRLSFLSAAAARRVEGMQSLLCALPTMLVLNMAIEVILS